MSKIKRSQFATFIDVTPDTEDYELLGEGVSTGRINMNPKTTEETYIHEDTATISLDSYAPKQPTEMTAEQGDPVFEYINDLYQTRGVLAAAETSVVNAWLYETVSGVCPAEQQPVTIAIDDVGGDGGSPMKINFTINYAGDKVDGNWTIATKVFVADV